jgi:uncharacterized membrane protein YagU involved in acid resistance
MLIDAARGALAGTAAVWLMDLVTTALLDRQSEEVTEQEEAARPNEQPALVNLVDRLEAQAGVRLSSEQREGFTQVLHYALGVVPGALYGMFRKRLPFVGAGNGLLYGLTVWAINDEYVNSALGLAGPFSSYPVETHWRGLVGHLVLGVATETGITLLGG